jgi:deoxycytidylate deaminase
MKKRYVIIASSYDKRNRLIHSCTNSYTDSSSIMRYYAFKAGYPKRVYNHAEVICLYHSIVRMKQKVDKLLVVRMDSNGNYKDCRPCEVCQLALKDFGIRTVLYSTETGVVKL